MMHALNPGTSTLLLLGERLTQLHACSIVSMAPVGSRESVMDRCASRKTQHSRGIIIVIDVCQQASCMS